MKEYFRKAFIFFLGLCMGIGIGMAIAYKNVYDEIPWYEEIRENTLEWIVEADNMEYLSGKLSQAQERFWEKVKILFPALAEQ